MQIFWLDPKEDNLNWLSLDCCTTICKIIYDLVNVYVNMRLYCVMCALYFHIKYVFDKHRYVQAGQCLGYLAKISSLFFNACRFILCLIVKRIIQYTNSNAYTVIFCEWKSIMCEIKVYSHSVVMVEIQYICNQ